MSGSSRGQEVTALSLFVRIDAAGCRDSKEIVA